MTTFGERRTIEDLDGFRARSGDRERYVVRGDDLPLLVDFGRWRSIDCGFRLRGLSRWFLASGIGCLPARWQTDRSGYDQDYEAKSATDFEASEVTADNCGQRSEGRKRSGPLSRVRNMRSRIAARQIRQIDSTDR